MGYLASLSFLIVLCFVVTRFIFSSQGDRCSVCLTRFTTDFLRHVHACVRESDAREREGPACTLRAHRKVDDMSPRPCISVPVPLFIW